VHVHVEWPPERVAADELAHLGFYVVPNDVQQHALRISEDFSTLDIAALARQQHNAVVSIAGVITTLRIRQTKKGARRPSAPARAAARGRARAGC
jgi:hypothetical protein